MPQNYARPQITSEPGDKATTKLLLKRRHSYLTNNKILAVPIQGCRMSVVEEGQVRLNTKQFCSTKIQLCSSQ